MVGPMIASCEFFPRPGPDPESDQSNGHIADASKLVPVGQKFDQGKPHAALLLDFRRALLEVSKVSTFGESKYGRPSGWKEVTNGRTRYADAAWRHRLAVDDVDAESGLSHKAHEAWNVLAELELMLEVK